MKKFLIKAGFTVPVLLAVVFIAGCAKFQDLGVYDSTVPPEQLCTLEIAGGIYIRQFNGEEVGYKKSSSFVARGWGLKRGYSVGSKGYATIQIPAGTHNFVTCFYMYIYGYSYQVEDVTIIHTFDAGRTYRLTAILQKANGEEQTTWTPSSVSGAKSVIFKIIEEETK
ncbi:MAG: hypothetical protein LBQ82_08275 [Treponema sp.]|jgi:hypothetical protein|nr:hypothetical protein [Treponema sp.]